MLEQSTAPPLVSPYARRVDPEAAASRLRLREYYLDEIVALQSSEHAPEGQDGMTDAAAKAVSRKVAHLFTELLILHTGSAGEELDEIGMRDEDFDAAEHEPLDI